MEDEEEDDEGNWDEEGFGFHGVGVFYRGGAEAQGVTRGRVYLC
jgi:hypothetical protein